MAFIDKASKDLVSQSQNAVLKVMIEKCLVHAKPMIKQKSLDCVLTMFEVSENFGQDTMEVIEEMCKSKKLPVRQFNTIIII